MKDPFVKLIILEIFARAVIIMNLCRHMFILNISAGKRHRNTFCSVEGMGSFAQAVLVLFADKYAQGNFFFFFFLLER